MQGLQKVAQKLTTMGLLLFAMKASRSLIFHFGISWPAAFEKPQLTMITKLKNCFIIHFPFVKTIWISDSEPCGLLLSYCVSRNRTDVLKSPIVLIFLILHL